MNSISNKRLLDVPTQNCDELNFNQVRFIDEYMVCGDRKKAYKIVFPDCPDEKVTSRSYDLLNRPVVLSEIQRRSREMSKSAIMDAQEILELYSKIARGEIPDQFGLDASLKDRISALKELSKIQIELAEKNKKQDNELVVKLLHD